MVEWVFDPWPGYTKDCKNGTHFLPAWHSVLFFGGLDHPVIRGPPSLPIVPSGDVGSNADLFRILGDCDFQGTVTSFFFCVRHRNTKTPWSNYVQTGPCIHFPFPHVPGFRVNIRAETFQYFLLEHIELEAQWKLIFFFWVNGIIGILGPALCWFLVNMAKLIKLPGRRKNFQLYDEISFYCYSILFSFVYPFASIPLLIPRRCTDPCCNLPPIQNPFATVVMRWVTCEVWRLAAPLIVLATLLKNKRKSEMS